MLEMEPSFTLRLQASWHQGTRCLGEQVASRSFPALPLYQGGYFQLSRITKRLARGYTGWGWGEGKVISRVREQSLVTGTFPSLSIRLSVADGSVADVKYRCVHTLPSSHCGRYWGHSSWILPITAAGPHACSHRGSECISLSLQTHVPPWLVPPPPRKHK